MPVSFFVRRLLLILRHLDVKNRPSSATVKLAKIFLHLKRLDRSKKHPSKLVKLCVQFCFTLIRNYKKYPFRNIFPDVDDTALCMNIIPIHVLVYLNQKWIWKSSLTWGKLSLNYSWQVLRTERRDSQRDRIFCFCQFAAVNAAADRYSHLLLWSHFVLRRR